MAFEAKDLMTNVLYGVGEGGEGVRVAPSPQCPPPPGPPPCAGSPPPPPQPRCAGSPPQPPDRERRAADLTLLQEQLRQQLQQNL